jgi:hypothetical protein
MTGRGLRVRRGKLADGGRLLGRLSGRPGANHTEIENFHVLYVFL